MGLKASDLPPGPLRDQLEAKLKGDGEAKPRSRAKGGGSSGGRCPGRCGCGETFLTYRKWERHSDETGHARWEMDL